MDQPQTASPGENIGFGIAAAAAGVYFILIGAGILPAENDPKAPLGIVGCAGLAFLFGGIAVIVQGYGRANAVGELPATAPSWLRVAQYVLVLGIFMTLAAIGSWIAFGPGPRAFSGTLVGLNPAIDSAIGRIAFGIGALVVWAAVITMAITGIRKLSGRERTGP